MSKADFLLESFLFIHLNNLDLGIKTFIRCSQFKARRKRCPNGMDMQIY